MVPANVTSRRPHLPTTIFLCYTTTKYSSNRGKYQIGEIFRNLLQNGIDSSMAKYVANILHRDPLQLVHGRIELDDEKQFTHAEMMMISVWHNIRLKIPPSGDPKTGWRVEFRPTEIQLTDYENAAFTCFLVLCTR